MKIGILSDTHIPVRTPILPPKISEVFQGVDKIIHAGDIEEQRVLDELSAIAPVTAVAGNMDHAIYGLPVKRSFKVGPFKIGVMHGANGPRHNMHPFLLKHLSGHDIIIYGHTHRAFWGNEFGVWFMNPGSPTDQISAPFRSVGLLEITDTDFNGKLITL